MVPAARRRDGADQRCNGGCARRNDQRPDCRKTVAVAIGGVTVDPIGSNGPALTDALGKALLTLGIDVQLSLKLRKGRLADQVVALQLPTTSGADAYVEVTMRTRDAPQTLADAGVGGTVTGRDGATLILPSNSLVNDAGAAVTGPVQISVTPVDAALPAAGGFPGQFQGIRRTAQAVGR